MGGRHEWPAQLYSEERQLALLEADHAAMDAARLNGTLQGEQVHAWSDFRQMGPHVSGGRSMLTDIGGLNFKGLFTRGRSPKGAASLIQRRYRKMAKLGRPPTPKRARTE